ncbi:LptA/OstA family protein [Permianibacter aggregans]|uniref:Lipopolysaccharide transport protein LptA n=1 Tax=Permianibacter aggregans TaxID=1510150 RepID=A0A4R6UT22_9GAMM|nr:LptA/OstA family protein [Permianibacter aggregans]TDQ46544.1 lipopolysaccharide transport protein LptA [Permianibacter aggregans]
MFVRLLSVCLLTLPAVAAEPATTRLKSDSMKIDGLSGKQHYQGSAVLTQDNVRISAEAMSTTQNDKGELASAHFTGNPVRVEHTDPLTGTVSIALANDVTYVTASGTIALVGDAQVEQLEPNVNRLLTLKAEAMQLTEVNGQLSDLKARGAPAVFSQTKGEELPVRGRANSLSYEGQKQFLVLQGNAQLQRGNSTLSHSVIEYDGINKTTNAPKRDGEQMEIQLMPEAQKGQNE